MVNFILRFRYYVAALAVVLAIVMLALAFRLPYSDVQRESLDSQSLQAVKVDSVRSLSMGSISKSIIGTVQSLSEADLRAEVSGTIIKVYKKSGTFVNAGTIVARITNAQEAAGVQAAYADIESAKAGVAQATAALNKVQGGTREQQLAILAVGVSNAENTLNEAIVSSKNTLSSAYSTSVSAVVRSADQMFIGADGANPHLSFDTTNYSQKVSAGNQRMAIQNIVDRHVGATILLNTLTDPSAITAELTKTSAELQQIKIFLDTLLIAVDGGISTASTPSSDLTAYKAAAESARSGVIGAISALSGSRSALSSTNSTFNIAKENESLGITGAQAEDVEAAAAALAQANAGLSRARAGLASASAVYGKTLIRTPISGTLTTLSIDTGDFVSMYQSVGVVANDGALEIIAYVSKTDASAIQVGSTVIIDSKYKGSITNVAAGLDPILHQVQVRIGVEEAAQELTHGESVSVELLQNTNDIRIPLAAVKFEADRIVVFAVSDEAKLVAYIVELGSIEGDLVEVQSGLTNNLEIVVDARGLYEGQGVKIKGSDPLIK